VPKALLGETDVACFQRSWRSSSERSAWLFQKSYLVCSSRCKTERPFSNVEAMVLKQAMGMVLVLVMMTMKWHDQQRQSGQGNNGLEWSTMNVEDARVKKTSG
jgi:hypothetical protein